MTAHMIDPSARIEAGAVIGKDVSIGPYCTIGAHVRIGDGCRLMGHVDLAGHTTTVPAPSFIHLLRLARLRSRTVIVGPTRLVVGADCDIRENVTMNIGSEDGGGITEVGDNCFFMVGAHVAHDCKVGNHVVFANNVLLGGHVEIGDRVVFAGAAVRQFVRIGEGAMIVGLSGVRADVIPYGMVHGPLADLIGLNVVGMRRRGLAKAVIQRVRSAYRSLFFGEVNSGRGLTKWLRSMVTMRWSAGSSNSFVPESAR